MVCKLKKESQKLRTAYWTLVGAASAMLITVQPVMADTIWDRFSTIMKDIYGQLVGISTIVAEAYCCHLDRPELAGLHCRLFAALDRRRQLHRLSP